MMGLKHEAAYYQTPFFKWRQRIGFGISDYACNLAYLLTNTYQAPCLSPVLLRENCEAPVSRQFSSDFCAQRTPLGLSEHPNL